MVKVLLAGAGGYGVNYLKELLSGKVEDAVLSGIADPFFHDSPYRAEAGDIPVTDSPAEFYARCGKADLTVISSPVHTHYRYTKEALAIGSDVLVEKPVVISLPLLDDLIKLEKESGHFVAVGYQLCFSRDILQMKKDILSGLYGKPLRMRSIRLMRRGDAYYSRNSWAGRFSSGGEYVLDSPLSNACAHQMQNMLFLLGDDMSATADVESVDGFLCKGRPSIENFDAAAIRAETDKGVPCFFYAAHCVDEKKVGPDSTYEFDKGRIVEKQDVYKGYLDDGTVIDYSPLRTQGLQKLYDAVAAVKTRERPFCTLSSSRAHVKTVLLAEDLPVRLAWDAERKMDDKGDFYYSVPGLSATFQESYMNWSIPDKVR